MTETSQRAPIRGVLFDKDGTLFDHDATWMPVNHRIARMAAMGDADLARELMLGSGYVPEAETVRSGTPLAAGSPDDLATAWFDRVAPLGWTRMELAHAIAQLFTEAEADAVPVCDLPAFLNSLNDAGFVLGVGTSDTERGALAMLDRFAARGAFAFIAGYDSGHGTKPGPGMVLGFCAHVGLHPNEVAVVGDNPHDMEMGRSAGAGLLVGVLTGTSRRADLAPIADHVLDDITHLPGILG